MDHKQGSYLPTHTKVESGDYIVNHVNICAPLRVVVDRGDIQAVKLREPPIERHRQHVCNIGFSLITFFFAGGQVCGPAIAGIMAEHYGSFAPAFLVAALITVAAAVFCLTLPRASACSHKRPYTPSA
ncbi:MAG: YbfB/YjiJ family MFS transporter [Desulfuromonadales bacterium]|nr:YbfB/YjiJ family MFS transporter [Desulfuromonadales bacterium]